MTPALFDRAITAGAFAAAAVMLLWQCRPARTSAEREPLGAHSVTQPAEAANAPTPVASPSATLTPALEVPAAWDNSPSASPPQPRPSAQVAGGTVQEVLDKLDAVDLDLYARIERETRRDVAPEVRAIVARRHAGASRAELASEIQRKIDEGSMRLLMARWLEDAFGTRAKVVTPPGAGSGPSLIRPLQSKSAPR